MALQPVVTLPISVFCHSCGRRWLQITLWPVGEVLLCACGKPAWTVVDNQRWV